MGALIIFLLVCYLITHKKDKKRKHRRTYHTKSDYERLCDDGEKFFNW